MELVGAGARDGGHEGSGVAAAVGSVAGGLNAELFEGVGVWKDGRAVEVGVVVISAVELIVIRVGARSVDGDRCILRLVFRGYASRPGDEVLQLEWIASVEWKIFDAFGIDDLADRAGARFDLSDFGADFDALGDGAYFELQIDSAVLVHLGPDVVLHQFLETGRFGGEGIEAVG